MPWPLNPRIPTLLPSTSSLHPPPSSSTSCSGAGTTIVEILPWPRQGHVESNHVLFKSLGLRTWVLPVRGVDRYPSAYACSNVLIHRTVQNDPALNNDTQKVKMIGLSHTMLKALSIAVVGRLP